MTACAGVGTKPVDGEQGANDIEDHSQPALWPDHLADPARLAAAAPPDLPATSPYPSDLWQRIRSGFVMNGIDHERVAAELRYYSRHPEFMNRVADRAAPYLHYIVEEVERRGMPMEVALLPVVESAYQPFAYSHGRAAGIWQFIPGTGKHYGLQQTWWYDGRRDVIASTDAALNYLDRLQKMFDGDWQLAFAAYNAGEGTVSRAIRRNRQLGRPTDYWSLSLPLETRQYVPRLLAVRALVEDPQVFDIELTSIADEPYLRVVDVGSHIDLALAAELADMAIEDIYRLNPGYNRWATDPDGPHRLALPLDNAERFILALAEVPENERVRWQRHRIASGESLGQIARRYGTTVAVLQEANGIRSHVIRAGDHLIVPASSKPSQHYALSADQRLARNQSRERQGKRINHTVQRGDTFWGMSRRYGVQVRELAAWNNMAPGDPLRPGQTLAIWKQSSGAGGNITAALTQGDPIIQRIRYTVRQGDSLYVIARRFRVSVTELRNWNNLVEGGYLQPGQRLVLHVDVRAQSGNI
ncbi:MAG: LysM peptidoglycan-binding domain-containing protein [Aquisalimonadaceae bacterium]